MIIAFVLWVLVGIGVGALVRNQVGAIVGVLVFTQFLEPVGRTAAGFVEGLSNVTRFLPGAASDALVGASLFNTATPGSTGGRPARVVGRRARAAGLRGRARAARAPAQLAPRRHLIPDRIGQRRRAVGQTAVAGFGLRARAFFAGGASVTGIVPVARSTTSAGASSSSTSRLSDCTSARPCRVVRITR